MKNVLVILAGSLLATTVKAQMPSPVDSLKISKAAGTTGKVSHSLSPNPRLLS